MKIKFVQKGRNLTCIITDEKGKKFFSTWGIKRQSQGLDPLIRARQVSFTNALTQVIGANSDIIEEGKEEIEI